MDTLNRILLRKQINHFRLIADIISTNWVNIYLTDDSVSYIITFKQVYSVEHKNLVGERLKCKKIYSQSPNDSDIGSGKDFMSWQQLMFLEDP